jgi:crotonobetainyl-CoA:carnitine CoA-transferase CaiB-like acyl-CoA transferase
MTNDNIFSGLKVVDLASFIAAPSAAVILSALLVLSQQFEPVRDTDTQARRKRSCRAARRLSTRDTALTGKL